MTFIASAITTVLLVSCVSNGTNINSALTVAPATGNADDLLIVDCLLPGQVRKLGTATTYITARRPIKTTASICEIRGGEYVAYDRADLTTALNIWLASAETGDAVAQTYVGEIYERGLGVPPDYQAAARWYQRAAEQGNARAQTNLGHLYEKGLGVALNKATALNWYRQASGLGDDQIAFTSSIEDLRRQLAASNQQTVAARQEAGQLRQQLTRLQGQLRNQEQALSDNQRALEQSREQLQSERQRQRQRMTPTPLAENNQEIRNLEQQVQSKEAQLVQLRRERGRLEQEASLLQTRLNNQSGDQTGLQQQIASLQQQLNVSQSELETRYQTQAQTLAAEQAELRQAQQEVQQTRAELARQQSLLAEQGNPEVQRLSGQIQQQEQLLTEKEQRIRELEAQQAAAYDNPELDSLRADLSQAQRELQQTRQALSQEQQQSNQNNDNVSQLNAQLQSQQQALASKQRQIDNLQQALAQTQEDNAQRELEAQRASFAQAQQQLAQAREALTQHSQSISTQSSGELERLQNELNAQEDLLQQRETKNQQLEQQLTTLKEQLEEARGREEALAQAVSQTRGDAIESDAQTQRAKFPNLDFGNYYALIIGNNTYSDFSNLETAVNDANDVANVLKSRYGFQTLVLQNASRYEILSALNDFREKLTDQDNFLLYYAGHGTLDQANTRGHWLPIDAEQTSTANWVSNTSVTDVINAMTAKHVMVIADSCYSGTLTRAVTTSIEGGRTPEQQEKWLKLMLKTRSRTVLSSGGLKPVLDGGGGRNSVFAKNLLNILRSNTDILEGPLLFRAVSRSVKQDAAQLGVEQNPLYSPIKFAGDLGAPFFFKPIN